MIDEKIRSALLPFGDPVEKAIYQSTAKRYYSFNYNTIGAAYADDAPEHVRYLIQVHLFMPLKEEDLAQKEATQAALYNAGFTWPDVFDATDEGRRHIIFECEDAGPGAV